MTKYKLTHTEVIKVLTKQEARKLGKNVITSSDARNERLPDNCFVTEVQILDPPEPIKRPKRHKKS